MSILTSFAGLVSGVLVVHRAVAAGHALQLVVEIDQDLVQRQDAGEHHAALVERLGVVHLPALLHDELA